jgi:hypothetical protein
LFTFPVRREISRQKTASGAKIGCYLPSKRFDNQILRVVETEPPPVSQPGISGPAKPGKLAITGK